MPDKEQHNDLTIRSEHIQEILNAPPLWMIRWGNILILILILGLLYISWFIKYPDTISGEISIATEPPSANIYALTTGEIDTVLVTNGDYVSKFNILLVLQHSGNYKDIISLKQALDTLQIDYNNFSFPIKKVNSFNLGDLAQYFSLFKRDYVEVNKQYSTRKDFVNIIASLDQLKKHLNEWERNHVLKSKIDGKAIFLNPLNKNQTIYENELIFKVIPKDYGLFYGRIKVFPQFLHKIKIGQQVNINLIEKQSTEYKNLIGTVKKISNYSDNKGLYIIDVGFPENINFEQDSKGTAKIITEDLRLIERFFYHFKFIF